MRDKDKDMVDRFPGREDMNKDIRASIDSQVNKGIKIAKTVYFVGICIKLAVLSFLIWAGIVLIQWITSK